jgi:choline dehydrogenase
LLNNTFDFIIVGGGTAGCILASRLSENSETQVLLIEEGGNFFSPWFKIPIGYAKLLNNKKITKISKTIPQPNLDFRSIDIPRASVIGGGSMINGMIYMQGYKSDFDNWETLGCEGWGWDGVKQYFNKFQHKDNNTEIKNKSPVIISQASTDNKIVHAFIDAGKELGYQNQANYGAPTSRGVGMHELTISNGQRQPSLIYLSKRKNLTILSGHKVSQLIVEGDVVKGVESMIQNKKNTFYAKKEVVLSAGALGTPKILQLSGIGPKEILRAVKVDLKNNLNGVGKNLQDHFQLRCVYKIKNSSTYNDLYWSYPKKIYAALKYIFFKNGPMAEGVSLAGLCGSEFINSIEHSIQMHLTLASGDSPNRLHKEPGITISVYQEKPSSRGSVNIKSNDPNEELEIDINYLNTKHDVESLVASLKLTRKVMNSKSMSSFLKEEICPGVGVENEKQIASFARSTGSTIYHQCGTCKMGNDIDSVVSSNLIVHSMKNLRIADASIMPNIVSGNTNATVMMIAEKASDIIKKYHNI